MEKIVFEKLKLLNLIKLIQSTWNVFSHTYKTFWLEVRCSFVFASSNSDWLKQIMWYNLPNNGCCLQEQMKIELHVERLYYLLYLPICLHHFAYLKYASKTGGRKNGNGQYILNWIGTYFNRRSKLRHTTYILNPIKYIYIYILDINISWDNVLSFIKYYNNFLYFLYY